LSPSARQALLHFFFYRSETPVWFNSLVSYGPSGLDLQENMRFLGSFRNANAAWDAMVELEAAGLVIGLQRSVGGPTLVFVPDETRVAAARLIIRELASSGLVVDLGDNTPSPHLPGLPEISREEPGEPLRRFVMDLTALLAELEKEPRLLTREGIIYRRELNKLMDMLAMSDVDYPVFVPNVPHGGVPLLAGEDGHPLLNLMLYYAESEKLVARRYLNRAGKLQLYLTTTPLAARWAYRSQAWRITRVHTFWWQYFFRDARLHPLLDLLLALPPGKGLLIDQAASHLAKLCGNDLESLVLLVEGYAQLQTALPDLVMRGLARVATWTAQTGGEPVAAATGADVAASTEAAAMAKGNAARGAGTAGRPVVKPVDRFEAKPTIQSFPKIGRALGIDEPLVLSGLAPAVVTPPSEGGDQPVEIQAADNRAECRFIVQPNFEILIEEDAPAAWIWQLYMVAETVQRDRMLIFRLTGDSLRKAIDRGITGETILRFLAAGSKFPLPQNVQLALEEWVERYGRTRLVEAVLLRCDTPELADQLQSQPKVLKLLGERIGPQYFLIPAENVKHLREKLQEAGWPALPHFYEPVSTDRDSASVSGTRLAPVSSQHDFESYHEKALAATEADRLQRAQKTAGRAAELETNSDALPPTVEMLSLWEHNFGACLGRPATPGGAESAGSFVPVPSPLGMVRSYNLKNLTVAPIERPLGGPWAEVLWQSTRTF